MPQAAIFTRSSPGPALGTGMFTSSAPKAGRVLAIAFMVGGFQVDFCLLNTTPEECRQRDAARCEESQADPTGARPLARSPIASARHPAMASIKAIAASPPLKP